MEELRNHRVYQIATGHLHYAAVTEDGALYTWETAREVDTLRSEPLPELGYGSFVHDVGAPYRVFGLESIRIASVAAGYRLTLASTEAGAVYSFGSDGHGHGPSVGEEGVFFPKRIQALDGIHVACIAAGANHGLALTKCGQVYSWGYRGSAQLGLGYGSNGHIPRLITALLGKRVRAVAAGSGTSIAVTNTGALYTWGHNREGRLGHGDLQHLYEPTLVQGLHGIRVVAASGRFDHTLVLAADGSVYGFGKGLGLDISQAGEIADGNEAAHSPRRIPGLVCMVPR
jgi:alpha-tubulin suppressor-like RCC1 family protein